MTNPKPTAAEPPSEKSDEQIVVERTKKKAKKAPPEPVHSESEESDSDQSESIHTESSEESEESESESSESESSDEPLFDFCLTLNDSKKVLVKDDCAYTFAIDVAVSAAKMGAEIRKKTESLRIVGKKYCLKLTPTEEDTDLITTAFEAIGSPQEASGEAQLLAYLLAM